MDLVADVTFYGKNKDFGPTSLTMKQKPMMQFQAMWRYHLSAASDLRFGLSQLTGGETQVEGVNQDDRTSSSKFWLGAAPSSAPRPSCWRPMAETSVCAMASRKTTASTCACCRSSE
jgi:hypothetical protein